MAVNLNYCQSVRIINGDTVVVMTVKQANDINKEFVRLKDSINIFKVNTDSIISDFTNYQIIANRKMNNYRAEKDSALNLYLVNKKIYEHREVEFRRERISQQFLTIIVMIITGVLAFK